MACAPFDHLRVPTYYDGVLALLEHGEDGKVIAGGQSLGPMLTLRLARPSVLIDINDVGEGQASLDGDVVRIPALTRQRTVAESPLVVEHAPLLAHCARHVGNIRVRNRGPHRRKPRPRRPDGGDCLHGARPRRSDRRAAPTGVVPAREFFASYLTTVLVLGAVLQTVTPHGDTLGAFGIVLPGPLLKIAPMLFGACALPHNAVSIYSKAIPHRILGAGHDPRCHHNIQGRRHLIAPISSLTNRM